MGTRGGEGLGEFGVKGRPHLIMLILRPAYSPRTPDSATIARTAPTSVMPLTDRSYWSLLRTTSCGYVTTLATA